MVKVWFTADLHIGHKNILKYEGRRFGDVETMNRRMREEWNTKIAENDIVYVLGDLAMGHRKETVPLFKEFNGRKRLISGNHDYTWGYGKHAKDPELHAEMLELYRSTGIEVIADEMKLSLPMGSFTAFSNDKVDVVLSHFPYEGDSGDEDRYVEARPVNIGKWLIHGHVHSKWRQRGRQINVGMDAWKMRPVSLNQILSMIELGPHHKGPLPTEGGH